MTRIQGKIELPKSDVVRPLRDMRWTSFIETIFPLLAYVIGEVGSDLDMNTLYGSLT